MEEKKTSVLANGLIWFGAAVSIAEILTGTFIAPLGFAKGMAAIFIGHAIGCALMFCAGFIGGKTGKSAMETVKMSFGQKGSMLFSGLNILQLIGWTAIMIFTGAIAANSIINIGQGWFWSLIIGGLIVVWLLIGVKNLGKVNIITMAALFILTIILSFVVFRHNSGIIYTEALSFGAAVELSAAMPLSWLPLISDYTRTAQKPVAATAVSTVAYFLTSSWMYIIGMGLALFTGESDIAAIMVKSGLGVAALLIIIFSTVTTTFLDTYSAGVSAESISKKLKETPTAVIICILGTLLAILTPITRFETFLYLIGSVFAPMIAIQIVDYFILKKDNSAQTANWRNLVLWLIGFVIYRFMLYLDNPIGSTIPVMVITGLLCFIIAKITGRKNYV